MGDVGMAGMIEYRASIPLLVAIASQGGEGAGTLRPLQQDTNRCFGDYQSPVNVNDSP